LNPGYLRVKSGIYKVRSYLERLNPETSGFQSSEQPERNGGLAAPAVRSAYEEGVFFSVASGHLLFPNPGAKRRVFFGLAASCILVRKFAREDAKARID
jgi:hypothetical protein